MTTLYLIRHGSNDFFTHTIVGRKPGVHLNDAGRREAEQLAEHLEHEQIQQIFSSPLERCRETAEPFAKKAGLKIQISEAINEIDFGEWTGRTFAELSEVEQWRKWNAFRSLARIPGGESMFEVRERMVAFVEKLRREFADERIALVSHGDPLRALILHFLGMPLEFIHRIELSPASVSVLALDDWTAQIRCLNARSGAGLAGR